MQPISKSEECLKTAILPVHTQDSVSAGRAGDAQPPPQLGRGVLLPSLAFHADPLSFELYGFGVREEALHAGVFPPSA